MSATIELPDLPAFQLLGQPVEIPKIDKELQALFLDGSDPDSGGVARASLINLALYNENQDGIERDSDTLAELTSEAACRSLLISSDRGVSDSSARAWVQVHCQIDRKGRKTVCTEQISFYLTGDSPGLLRNIVFAHLDSDLPLAFWWRGELSDAFEERLYSRIDRLLFDSECWEMPRNHFIRLDEAQQHMAQPFVMHDLAFTRLNSIRHAVANAFDRLSTLPSLESLDEVSIRFAAGYHMSALYLAGWIASRLGAKVDAGKSSATEMAFVSSRKGSPSSFQLSIGELDPERKGTIEVDFAIGDCRVEISRCQTRNFMRTLIHRPDTKTEENWLPARKMTDTSLVTDILNRAGRNRTFAQVLPEMRELLTLK